MSHYSWASRSDKRMMVPYQATFGIVHVHERNKLIFPFYGNKDDYMMLPLHKSKNRPWLGDLIKWSAGVFSTLSIMNLPMMGPSREKNFTLKAVYYFRKKLHHRCLKGS